MSSQCGGGSKCATLPCPGRKPGRDGEPPVEEHEHPHPLELKRLFIQTDQSNAFGSPDVEAILRELDDKISDGAHDLLKSFLLQSEAMVQMEGRCSVTFKTSPRGFTQGSCMSPICFCSLDQIT